MFSATGNILRGSRERPDFYIETHTHPNNRDIVPEGIKMVNVRGVIKLKYKSYNTTAYTHTYILNALGRLPVVSTFTGCFRAFLGLIHSIVHLVSAIFDAKNRALHLKEVKLGGKNIGRGLIEMLPIIGNITMLVVDNKRIKKFKKEALKTINEDPVKYDGFIVTFSYGKEIGWISEEDYNPDCTYDPRIFDKAPGENKNSMLLHDNRIKT